jgi:hypothetical protein
MKPMSEYKEAKNTIEESPLLNARKLQHIG